MVDHRERMRVRSRPGTSLVEVVMASLLIGIVMVGALKASGAVLRARRAAATMATGPMLAEDLLAEMMAMPYIDPDGGTSSGTDTGETDTTRADFDDVDDYNGWTENGITDKSGLALAEYTDWQRTAQVDWAERVRGTSFNLFDTGLKRIKVTVTSPDGKTTELYGYRADSGALEQPPTVDTQVITWLQATLVVADAQEAEVSTSMLNHVEDPAAADP